MGSKLTDLTRVTTADTGDLFYLVRTVGDTGVSTAISKKSLEGLFQPLDSDLTSWAAVTRASGFDTFASTPSSANLAALLTDETGSGANVHAVSPALTGTPTAPTAAVDTNTTQIATTAMVLAQAAAATPLGDAATAAVGTSTRFARADHVHPGREVLTAARTYYVRTDGSNSNTGLVDSAGGAFLTIQKAIDVIAALDIATFAVTIQVGNGTYTGAILVTGPWVGSGNVSIVGDTTTPSNVVISVTSNHAVQVKDGGRLRVRGVKIQTTTSGTGILADTNGIIQMNGLFEVGACATYHMNAQNGGSIVITANYTISGGALYHWIAVMSGLIDGIVLTITLSGTPAFSQSFAYASRSGTIQCHLNTFSGSGTGTRYTIDAGSTIFTNNAGATYLPGNAAGVVNPGGYLS